MDIQPTISPARVSPSHPCDAHQCRVRKISGHHYSGGSAITSEPHLRASRSPLQPCLATRLCPPWTLGLLFRTSIFLLPHLLVPSATISLACLYLSLALIISWLQGFCLPGGFSRHPLLPSLPFTETDDNPLEDLLTAQMWLIIMHRLSARLYMTNVGMKRIDDLDLCVQTDGWRAS